MGCRVEGSPRYNAHYLACTGSPALSGRNQNNMPVAFSCRRPSWLEPRVETRGEEEKVNAEGASAGRVDKDRAQRKAAAAAGMQKINSVSTACKCHIRRGFFFFIFVHTVWVTLRDE